MFPVSHVNFFIGWVNKSIAKLDGGWPWSDFHQPGSTTDCTEMYDEHNLY